MRLAPAPRRDAAAAPAATEESGTRRSIVSGERLAKERMVRFVVAPDGSVVPDIDERLPGRGLWIEADRDMLSLACARNRFAGAARKRAVVPPDLAERVVALITRRCVERLGLARRAGQAVAGYERAADWARGGRAAVLVVALDAAPATRQRLSRLSPAAPCVAAFDAATLGPVFGREAAVNVVLAPGRLADAFLRDARRLEGLRGPGGTNELS